MLVAYAVLLLVTISQYFFNGLRKILPFLVFSCWYNIEQCFRNWNFSRICFDYISNIYKFKCYYPTRTTWRRGNIMARYCFYIYLGQSESTFNFSKLLVKKNDRQLLVMDQVSEIGFLRHQKSIRAMGWT